MNLKTSPSIVDVTHARNYNAALHTLS